MCCQPTELIWVFFFFHNFSIFTPPPLQQAEEKLSLWERARDKIRRHLIGNIAVDKRWGGGGMSVMYDVCMTITFLVYSYYYIDNVCITNIDIMYFHMIYYVIISIISSYSYAIYTYTHYRISYKFIYLVRRRIIGLFYEPWWWELTRHQTMNLQTTLPCCQKRQCIIILWGGGGSTQYRL